MAAAAAAAGGGAKPTATVAEGGDGGSSFRRFSRREWLTLFALGSVHFGSSLCVALQAPFYPHEAEMKGATATEYGLVFGIYELVSFVSSPLFGKYMDFIGAKLLLTTGIFVAAGSSILFGLLDLVHDHLQFISLSFFVRAVEALGSSAAVTAAFSITATVFSDSVATTFATLEVFYGFGYIVGPTLGGLLFSMGGYMLPFVVMGSLLVADGVFVLMALPPLNDGRPRTRAKGHLLRVLRVPAVLMDVFAIMCTAVSMGFNAATLEPHLREFSLTPVLVGLVFVISGGTYALTAPFVGRLCDKAVPPRRLMLLGSACVAGSYLLVGPAPFVPAEPQLPAIVVGLVFHGLGVACVLVPCFIDAIRSAVAYGFPDDITTHGLVSGLWASSFALGDFIGPSVAGVLYDLVGFRLGTLFVVGLHLIVLAAVSLFVCSERRQRRRQLSDSRMQLAATAPPAAPAPAPAPAPDPPAGATAAVLVPTKGGGLPNYGSLAGSGYGGYGSGYGSGFGSLPGSAPVRVAA